MAHSDFELNNLERGLDSDASNANLGGGGARNDVMSDQSKHIHEMQIEDFPQGYPRFSALVASDRSFQIWRRFSNLRTRLLLLKQDELSQLEEQLMGIDSRDIRESFLFLGSCRLDTNDQRSEVIRKIDIALKEYDSLIESNQRALSLESASNGAVSSLQIWLEANLSVARAETRYLDHTRDLFSFRLSGWLDRQAVLLAAKLELWIDKHHSRNSVSRDGRVIFLRPSVVKGAVRILLVLQAPVIAILLFTPVIICNYVDDLTRRIIIVVLTTAAFIAVLSFLAKVRVIDLVVAGATYATVLVVFISGTNGLGS